MNRYLVVFGELPRDSESVAGVCVLAEDELAAGRAWAEHFGSRVGSARVHVMKLADSFIVDVVTTTTSNVVAKPASFDRQAPEPTR